MDRMEIVLPVPLPTVNRLLAMHHFEAMKLRHLLHLFVELSADGQDWPEAAEFDGKMVSTELLKEEYMYLIRPGKGRKARLKELRDREKGLRRKG